MHRFKDYIVALLLVIMSASWAYVKAVEYAERDIFVAEVNDFMSMGPRFTKEEAAELESRVQALEEAVSNGD